MNALNGSDADVVIADVVIAGGGMVGATLALALAQGGLRVAVADPMTRAQMEDERFDGRVAALAFASVRMLKILGVWDRLEKAAQPIQDILVNETEMGRGPLPFSLHFDHREIGEPLGHIVENRHIRQALLACVERESRIRFLPGTSAAAIGNGGRNHTRRASLGRQLVENHDAAAGNLRIGLVIVSYAFRTTTRNGLADTYRASRHWWH